MKRSRLLFAALLLAALVALKLLLPDLAASVRQKAADTLTLDRDYLAVFGALGDRLAAGSRAVPAETETPAAEIAAPKETSAPAPRARAELTGYVVEEAETLGERVPVSAIPTAPESEPDPEPELPAAVTVFLESQAEFLDNYALPDNVDYTYTEFPFDYALPVSGYSSSGFGYRMHPILNDIRFHYGTDIAANSGEDIFAFADGTVTFAGTSDGYGNYITVDHSDGWTSSYAHCSKLYVQSGQAVTAGEKIALVGATGRVTGPHLHFELRHDGIYVNPEYYINV